MRVRAVSRLILILAIALPTPIALQAAGPQQAGPLATGGAPASFDTAAVRRTLDQYCVTCHNQRLKTAGLALDTADLARVSADAETWEKVVQKLQLGTMPPVGVRRPDEPTYRQMAALLEEQLDRAAAERPDPGRRILHRLNRAEYANAVRDLLGIDVDVTSLLPPDDAAFGFDNVADALGSSPAL